MHFAANAQYQFIENKGQWNKKALFKAYVDAGEVYIENDGLRFFFYDGDQVEDFHKGLNEDSILDCHSIKLKFFNAQKPSAIEKSIENPTKYNYFLGNNKNKWANDVGAFERIVLKNVYEGIDFEIYSYQYKIKYNFYVHPGADPSQIQMQYLGADKVFEKDGNINVYTSLRKIIEEQPYSFQKDDNNQENEVLTRFKIEGDLLKFDIKGSYRKERMLVIDPTVVFATFSGSTADNFGFTATYDDDGNAYSGGTVYNFGFPVTLGAFQLKWKDGVDVDTRIGDIRRDIGILKYSTDGTSLLYATYIGGSHNEDPHSMVVNSKQELLIFGNTGSPDFPTTISAYDTSFNGSYDMYVAHLSANGQRMLNCTYIGGSDKDGLNGQQVVNGGSSNSSELGFNYGDLYRGEIIVDDDDQIFVASVSRSDDFPVTSSAVQKKRNGKHDAIVLKMSADLSQLLAATYYGASNNEAAYGIGIDDFGSVFICGGTSSSGLVFKGKSFQDTFNQGLVDGFALKLSNNLDSIFSGTYFGTSSYDQVYFLQIDDSNYVYVTGQTMSDSFITKNTKFSQPKGKQFISKFSNNLDSLCYSGTFGSGRRYPDLSPSAFLVDQCARIYFTGWGGLGNFNGRSSGRTTDLPIPDSAAAEKSYSLGADFYLAVFAENMDTILYGSYFGGDTTTEHVDGGTSRYNKAGIVYQSVCAGCGAGSSDFPVTKGVVSKKNKAATGNLCNNALFKVDFDAPVLYALFSVPEVACFENNIVPINRSINALEYEWDFGDGFTSTQASPTHKYADTGSYTITLIVKNIFSCPGKDTLSKTIYIYKQSQASFSSIPDDCGWAYDFKNTSALAQTFNWSFGDGNWSNFENTSHRYQDSGTYIVRLLTDSGTACADSILTSLKIANSGADFTYLPDSCEPYVNFFDKSDNSVTWLWEFETGKFSTDNAPGYYFPDTGKYDVVLRINQDKPCYDSIIKTIYIKNSAPIASFDLTIDSCNFNFNGINTSTNSSAVKWLFTDTFSTDTANFKIDTAGSYIIKLVTNPFSGCPDTSERVITFQDNSIANFKLDIDTCLSKIKTTNLSSNAKSFLWIIDDLKSTNNSPTFTLSDTGTFEIWLITNPYSACADTLIDTASINVIKYAEFEFDIVPCKNAVVLRDKSLNAKTTDWDYDANIGDWNLQGDTLFYEAAGTHKISVIIDKDDASCSDTFSRTIELIPPLEPFFEYTNKFCNSYFSFSGLVNEFENATWSIDGKTVSVESAFGWKFNDTLKHLVQLSVKDTNGCIGIYNQTINAQELSLAIANLEIDSCTGATLLKSESVDANTYYWTDNNDSISNEKSATYQIPSANEQHTVVHIINKGTPCADTTKLTLAYFLSSIETVSIPNIFSPNNDGVNDIATVEGLNTTCDEAALYIYDRWGVLVFEDLTMPYQWAGVNPKNNDVVTGVYFYIFELNGQVKSGTFTLVR